MAAVNCVPMTLYLFIYLLLFFFFLFIFIICPNQWTKQHGGLDLVASIESP